VAIPPWQNLGTLSRPTGVAGAHFMTIPRGGNSIVILAAVLALASACGRGPRPIAVEPEATFAAHPTKGGLTIDRMRSGGSGALDTPGWLRGGGTPDWVLRAGGETRGALWVVGQSRILVRRGASSISARSGEAIAAWDDGAIRLALHLPDGSSFRTDAFAREGGGTGPALLSRAAQTVLEVRGSYRAALRDGGGAPVGWFRVRVGPYRAASRIYDAVLPAALDDALAAAAALVLDGEVSWIEDHAIDVYRGTGDEPLRRSMDLGR
jgi:hypothetical protein